jgi:hypothetical protein
MSDFIKIIEDFFSLYEKNLVDFKKVYSRGSELFTVFVPYHILQFFSANATVTVSFKREKNRTSAFAIYRFHVWP